MPRVTFQALGKTVEIPDGATVFDAGAQVHAMIETACVGKGTCGLCRVKILEGAEHLTPYTDEEHKHLGNVYHLTRVRLSCRARVSGATATVVIDLAPRRVKKGG
jgi:2Fe-2S ferredoxin